jgi:endonuclease/exonuclease/phosphatase family metal-dependent hydrolase
MDFKVATVNSFFDGVSVEDLTANSWLKLHWKVFTGNVDILKKHHDMRVGPHPIKAVFEKHQPDIVIVNEVIETDGKNETIQFLNDQNFYGVELDSAVEVTAEFKRGTLVASRFESEPVEIDIQRFPGGRFSALKIAELNLIVIGVQGTPFNWLVRKHQIRVLLSYFKKFEEEGYRVIVAGDFNMGIRHSDLTLPEGIKHFTERSFPSPRFHDTICDEKSISAEFMRTILKLRKGPRSLDHILYSASTLELIEGMPQETVSDHCALVAQFRA